MADNVAIPNSGSAIAAADQASYSGDSTALIQLMRPVHVTGAEGSKVVSELVRLEDSAHTSGDPGIPIFGVVQTTLTALSATNGDYVPPQFTPSGSLRVAIAEDAVGSTVDADSNAVVVGNVAHDGADTRAPVKIGAKAETALSGITLVADGDRTDLHAGVDGVIITRPHCNLEDIVTGNASDTTGGSIQIIAAQAAGIKTYLTQVTLTNTHASTFVYVELKDGGTAKHTIPVPPSSGATVQFPVPLPGTAATAWNFDPSAAVSTIFCSAIGFKSKV